MKEPFGNPFQELIPLFGMVDIESGVSILMLSAYGKIAKPHALIQPYEGQVYAVTGMTINNIGIVEEVSRQLGGHTLKTNFFVIADHIGVEYFQLARKFLRTYNVLLDFTANWLTIRDPRSLRQFKAGHEFSNSEQFL